MHMIVCTLNFEPIHNNIEYDRKELNSDSFESLICQTNKAYTIKTTDASKTHNIYKEAKKQND